jgi:hypothetical protein
MQSRAISAWALFTAMAMCAVSAPSNAAGGNLFSFGKPDFELTGTAYDANTRQPIEGAYVVAIYYESAVGLAGSDTWCVKTKGMYTSKDGRFSFPIEALDSRSPRIVAAIKPGYYSGREVFPKPEIWKKQGREAYSGRDTPLIPQDPAKPEWVYGTNDVFCARAANRDDAAAGIEFLRIRLSEQQRLKSNPMAIESTANMIKHLENLPMGRSLGK